MRAAVLHAFGRPLDVQALPDPVLGTGEVVVDVVAAAIPGYTHAIFSGARNYLLELPIVPGPGGIGRVRSTGPDSTRLSVGDWVFCDSTVRSRDDAVNPDKMLLGWTASTAEATKLQRYYHNGSYAEQVLVPTENVTPIGDIDSADAGRWCAVGSLLVPYGGLLTADLRPGETVVVNGATGGFGSAAVAVALAMGAGQVVATGRNAASLCLLVERFGPRVKTATMTEIEAKDRELITDVAGVPIDCVLDLLPREATVSQVRAAAMTVRTGGRVVLMGGVGRAGGPDLPLPYDWIMRGEISLRGQWMYPRDAVPRMIQLVRTGLLDLGKFDVTEFPLDDVNDAVGHAAETAGPLRLTVLRPDRASA